MGDVVKFSRHARASSRSRKKSSAVTCPAVSEQIFSAISRDGQPLPSQSEVIQPAETPIESAKSPRLIDLDLRYSASFITEGFSVTKTLAQEKSLVWLDGLTEISPQFFGMAKVKRKPKEKKKREVIFKPAFIKAWREHRGMSQEDLCAKVGMSTGNLSNIETGIQGYTQGNLEVMAPALRCEPADLVAGPPGHADSILAIWARATSDERERILTVASALVEAKKV